MRVPGKLKKTQEEANIARMEIEEKKEREKKASLDKKELVSALNQRLTVIDCHGEPRLQNRTHPCVLLTHPHSQQEKELAQLREKRNEEISIMDEQIKLVGVGQNGVASSHHTAMHR